MIRFFPSTIRDLRESIYDTAIYVFSPRLLGPSYTGPCASVRRTSDGEELDIDFVSDLMDESAISTHCGASDGYISYYNQGTKADGRPSEFAQKIYDGSSVLKLNTKPAGLFNLNVSTF